MIDDKARGEREERIDVTYEYELCAWARHFNASEQRVREAVAAVGDRADRVRRHLERKEVPGGPGGRQERPSANG